ncbi:MAG: Ig-like domain-containing protein [Polyangia bacterium]
MHESLHPLRRPLAALAVLCTLATLHCGGEQPAAPAPDSASLSLSPSNPQIAMGTAQQFALRALAADGRMQEMTDKAEWSLQDESGRSTPMPPDGFLQIDRPGRYTVTARIADRRLSTPISVTAATLSSVALSPRTPSVAKGSTLAFTATATFSDGSTQDVTKLATWSVKDVTGVGVATIDTTGVMQARAVGSARITARFQTRSSYTTAEITPAKLTRVVVSPPTPTLAAGTSVRFSALGTYSDGTTTDVSSQVTWSISDVMGTGVASIDGTGTANGLHQGQALISAELDALVGTTLLTVGPGVPVRLSFSTAPAQTPKGTTARFVAMADLSDGGTQDVSALVTWTATDVMGTAVASVSASGVVTGNNVGKATITAALRGLSVSSSFEVTPAVLTAIQLSSTSLSLFQAQAATLTATGIYSDGTRKDLSATADWASVDVMGTSVLASVAGGRIVAKNVGQARVTATQAGFSASATVEVKASSVTSLVVSPDTALYFLSPVQLTATATLMGGGTLDVTNLATWSLDVIGTPADWKVSKGLVTAGSTGSSTVTATYMGFTSSSLVIRLF